MIAKKYQTWPLLSLPLLKVNTEAKKIKMSKNVRKTMPGDGLRSLQSTMLFRAINYELYVKPNKIVMILGTIAILGCSGYIFYMNSNQRKSEYHTMIKSDDTVELIKKRSKWFD